MAEPLEIAIRAEESARAAHQRLDRMNGSLDRLTHEVASANAKSDQILLRLAKDDGSEDAKEGLFNNIKFIATLVAVILSSSLVALIFTWLTHTHG